MRNHKNIVVTLMWNKWTLTERLLDGLRKQEGENIDRVFIVDNHSEDSEYDCALSWMSKNKWSEVWIERLDANIGFTLGANYGLQRVDNGFASRQLVYLISNDVQINGKFIHQAEDVLLGAKRALVGNRHIDWDSGWNKHNGILFDYLEGYLLAATSDGWRDLGYFDPNYAPFDYEDIDLSTTAKKKGYKLVSLNNPNIIHQNGGTIGFNPEREKITRRNMEYFKRKWTD